MKYLSNISNINRIHNYWNQFGKEYSVSDIFLCLFFSCGQKLEFKKLTPIGNFEPKRKNVGLNKYPRKTFLDSQNTHEKNLWPTRYPLEKPLDPQNTHEKKIGSHKIPTKARWHNGTRPTRSLMVRNQRNLAHPFFKNKHYENNKAQLRVSRNLKLW